MVSVQINCLPVFRNSGVSGWTISMRQPVISGFFTVHQSEPTTRPRYMALIQMHFVDNADDRIVDRSILAALGQTGATARHRDYTLADTRAYGIDADDVAAFVLTVRRDRLDNEQLLAFQTRVFACGHDGAHHAGENHESPR